MAEDRQVSSYFTYIGKERVTKYLSDFIAWIWHQIYDIILVFHEKINIEIDIYTVSQGLDSTRFGVDKMTSKLDF